VGTQSKAEKREIINEFIAAADAEATLEIVLIQWHVYYAAQPPADDGCECVPPLDRHANAEHEHDERRN
jgi:hypothetical protein